jgi:hypothetical protein
MSKYLPWVARTSPVEGSGISYVEQMAIPDSGRAVDAKIAKLQQASELLRDSACVLAPTAELGKRRGRPPGQTKAREREKRSLQRSGCVILLVKWRTILAAIWHINRGPSTVSAADQAIPEQTSEKTAHFARFWGTATTLARLI